MSGMGTEGVTIGSGRWVTMSEAAARFGISYRTLQRRIKSGTIQTREGDGGRPVVWIDDPDVDPPVAEADFDTERFVGRRPRREEPADEIVSDDGVGSIREQAFHQIQLAGAALATGNRLAESQAAMIEASRTEVRVARRWAHSAWAVVAALGLVAVGLVWWAASTTVEQEGIIERLSSDLAGAGGESERLADSLADTNQSRAAMRTELEETRIRLATVEVQAAARQGVVESVTSERDRLATRVSQLEAQVDALTAQVAAQALDIGEQAARMAETAELLAARSLEQMGPPPPAIDSADAPEPTRSQPEKDQVGDD